MLKLFSVKALVISTTRSARKLKHTTPSPSSMVPAGLSSSLTMTKGSIHWSDTKSGAFPCRGATQTVKRGLHELDCLGLCATTISCTSAGQLFLAEL